MNSPRRPQAGPVAPHVGSAPPSVQTPPPAIDMGRGHPEYHFVVGLMEVKGQLGQIAASLESLTKSVDSVKADVKGLNSLKDKMHGAVWVLGIVSAIALTILGFIAKVGYDYAMKPPPIPVAVAVPVVPQALPAPPVRTKQRGQPAAAAQQNPASAP